MSSLKERLHKMLMQDQLEEVIDFLLAFTQKEGLNELHESVVIQAGQANDLTKASKRGTLSFDETNRARNRIREGVMEIIREVEGAKESQKSTISAPISSRKKGISEQSLKKHVLFLIFLLKIIVIGFLFTLWELGGFSTDQFHRRAQLTHSPIHHLHGLNDSGLYPKPTHRPTWHVKSKPKFPILYLSFSICLWAGILPHIRTQTQRHHQLPTNEHPSHPVRSRAWRIHRKNCLCDV